jgi:transcription factor WhiB
VDFLQALKARPWTDRALCAQAPHAELNWVMEPGNGTEPRVLVHKLLGICRECPVRAECLRDSLETMAFDVFGVWGGSVRSERNRLMDGSRNSATRIYADTRAPIVEAAFQVLFDTLDARIHGWQRLVELDKAEAERTRPERERRALERRLQERATLRLGALRPAGSCRTCDRAFTWRDRSDARFCSGRCRQAAFRGRPKVR